MKKPLALLAAAGILAAGAVPAFAATRTVKIGDNWFVKPGNGRVSVKKGTTVRWVNVGRAAHNVKVRRGPVKFRSRTILPGRSFRKRMTVKGRYRLICTIHSGQRMTLRVR